MKQTKTVTYLCQHFRSLRYPKSKWNEILPKIAQQILLLYSS